MRYCFGLHFRLIVKLDDWFEFRHHICLVFDLLGPRYLSICEYPVHSLFFCLFVCLLKGEYSVWHGTRNDFLPMFRNDFLPMFHWYSFPASMMCSRKQISGLSPWAMSSHFPISYCGQWIVCAMFCPFFCILCILQCSISFFLLRCANVEHFVGLYSRHAQARPRTYRS